MTQEEYLKNRVEDQIAWYDQKSQVNQQAYKRLRMIEIVAAAMIPLLAAYTDAVSALKLVVGGLGVLIAVLAGVISLYRFQENWSEYRITAEALKQEKFLFLTRAEPYEVDDPLSLFVQRVESLLAREHSTWVQSLRAGAKGKGQS